MRTLSHLFACSLIACTAAHAPLALAEEDHYICATVEEFLEPSEDCAYFRVSGDFVLKDNPEKTLGYYLFYDDESQRDNDLDLLNESFDNQRPVYMLVGSRFVTKIEDECR